MEKKNKSETSTKEKNNSLKKFLTKKNLIILGCIIICIILLIVFINRNKDIAYVTLEEKINDMYEWKYEIENKKIVKFVNKENIGSVNRTTKRNLIKETYRFQALREGKTTIKFIETNTSNGSFLEIKYYNVTVDKNLKLTIEEKQQ